MANQELHQKTIPLRSIAAGELGLYLLLTFKKYGGRNCLSPQPLSLPG
jgi:hypothetical protein